MISLLRSACFVLLLLLSTGLAFGQGHQRYRDEVFASFQVSSDIPYGRVLGKSLFLDIYTGTNDTVKNRPLAIFIHAGGFQTGNKVVEFAKLVCGALSRRGYVAASIDYRLSSPTNDTSYFEAMLRALHDAKAAVRFFRKNGTLYGVDTSQIFVVGSSAGSIIALHLAYLDSVDVPKYVDWNRADSSFEGTSWNPGFSSRVQGVISNWGAIGDTAWMKKGDAPVYCVHGTSDSTIYYNLVPAYGPFRFSSKYIVKVAQDKGIPNGLRLFLNAGHELNGDIIKQDSAITSFSEWLYTMLTTIPASVQQSPAPLPGSFLLFQNFPNPFNPKTVIVYQLTVGSDVTLAVYDLLGREVEVLVNERQTPGQYTVSFDGSKLVSGIYFYRLTTDSFILTRKMIVLK